MPKRARLTYWQFFLSLPNLLYIGSVPVEAELSGGALLYRLLCDYPSEKLLVMQRDAPPLGPRLPKVMYMSFNDGIARWVPSSWPVVNSLRPLAIAVNVIWLSRKIAQAGRKFGAMAVLTVTHGPYCLLAASVAKRLQVPLYLINHDNWPDTVLAAPPLRWYWSRTFRAAYVSAAARLCISPYMASFYERRYGVPSSVLLPCRAKEVEEFSEPPGRHSQRPFTIAYAGSFHAAYAESFQAVASALNARGGRLAIYSNLGSKDASQFGLDSESVLLYGTMPSRDLVVNLRATADALVLVLADNLNARVCFPSKLVDYTATGLPILILAPGNSSAARWAREAQSAAIVVGNHDRDGIARAVSDLESDPGLRRSLGRASLAAGRVAFSYFRARDQFFSTIRSVR